ncbi:MAG: transglutaminase family protein [Firmicutes bacterium]|nr:transglutaminase family protein [Bacillota bacterium]
MKLSFSYTMALHFSKAVEDQFFSMICLPVDTARQKVLELNTLVQPETVLNEDTDGFGNRKLYGCVREPHREFLLRTEGAVETGSALYEEWQDPADIGLVRYQVPTDLTAPGPVLQELFREWAAGAPEDPYGKLLYYGRLTGERIRYVPGTTDSRTTAEQAAALESGVCQDIAHVLIALLRMAGMPARYTVGLIPGEGESHAWVEANCRGYWYGFDPTNQLLVDEGYIKISHGRDYRDCMISRGIFKNPYALQTMEVSVSVAQAEE